MVVYPLQMSFVLSILLFANNIMATEEIDWEAEPKCHEDVKCLAKKIKLGYSQLISEDGQKVQEMETADYLIRTERDYLGLFEHIDTVSKENLQLVQRDWLTPNRVTQFFGPNFIDGKPEILRQREIHRLSDNKRFYKILTTEFEAGKPVRQEAWHINGDSRLLQYSQCLNGVTPVSLTSRQLARSVQSLFRTEETSPERIRLVNDSCPASYEREVAQAMTEGMGCMLDSRRGGGSRSQRDVGLLLAMMTNPNQRYTVKCFQGGSGIPGHGHVMGVASMCDGDPNVGKAPYPGINIDVDTINAAPSRRRSAQLRATVYHEMLHTLGYPHGHAPDVSYLCEYCCFGGPDTPSAQKQMACNLCKSGDRPTPEYIGKLFNYTQKSSDTQSDQYGFDFAYLSMGNYARSAYQLRGNKNVSAEIATKIVEECPGGQAASCPYEMARAALVQFRAQALLAEASTPGVRALTSAEQTLITQLESTLSGTEELQTIMLTAGLMAGHVRGGSLDYARRFSRTQLATYCNSISSDDRSYIADIMPPAFEIEYGIDNENFWQTACGN